MVKGLGVSKGIGMGRAIIADSPRIKIQAAQVTDIAAERNATKKQSSSLLKRRKSMLKSCQNALKKTIIRL